MQQPRRRCAGAGLRDSARCTPTTSCPASTARAAATAESTPPLMAASTLISDAACGRRPCAAPRARSTAAGQRRAAARRRRPAVRGVAEGEAQRRPRAAVVVARPSRAARGWAGPRRPSRPSRWSTRCRWASSSSSSASPSQPGKEKCALPGSRSAGSGSPLQHGVRARPRGRRRPARRAARADPGGLAGRSSAAHARPRRRSRAIAGASRVPERTSRSWPPPCSSGTQLDVAAEQQRADADRAAELVRR